MGSAAIALYRPYTDATKFSAIWAVVELTLSLILLQRWYHWTLRAGRRTRTTILIIVTLAALLAARFLTSPSPAQHTAERKRHLLSLYPVGITRADLQQRLEHMKLELSERRPLGGWTECLLPGVREGSLAAEQRTGKQVERCERYRGVHGLFSLSFYWFYYDQGDRVVDADWYITD